ncbi:Organic cation/carnitine transporter 3 [Dorcoceras hygrometricum]|uniref:Organic cation/carnitine transporter 3 n=1 Tax=Dorcoceras hygrometricum TaxID=472368 RepID=A0A2Z7D268_9LAMI|nr:Organic cation/carnitine transporter 3 [Dorcoceras hygrometricum]
MADVNPLLSHTNVTKPEVAPDNQQYRPTLDDTIEQFLGEFGWGVGTVPTQNPNGSARILRFRATTLIFASFQGNLGHGAFHHPHPPFLNGGFVHATLADSSLGRKKMLVVSSLVMSLSGVLATLSPNVWVYTALRFVSGLGRAPIGARAIVLPTESVGKNWRGKLELLMYLLTSVPPVVYSVLMYFTVEESPRWLFINGRKEEFMKSILGLTLVSGICCVACVSAKQKGAQMGMELVSFFSACMGANVFLIYALELFPTCVRSSAVSMLRQAGMLGGVLDPVLVAAGKLISYGVFGVTIGLCGLCAVWLPETKRRTLCDNMEEEEELRHNVVHNHTLCN